MEVVSPVDKVGQHFEELRVAIEEELKSSEGSLDISNDSYCPPLIQYMCSSVMPLAPLWSQVVTSQPVSNACVETWFKTVKKNIMFNRKRLQPGEFVELLMKETTARQKESLIPPRLTSRKRRAHDGQMAVSPNDGSQRKKKRKRGTYLEKPYPIDTKSTPMGGKTSRSARKTTPMGGKTSRSARKTAPMGGKTSRSARKTAPMDGKTSRSARKTAPMDGKASRTATEATSVGGKTSRTARETTSVGGRTSPSLTRESTPVGGRTSSSARESTPVGGRTSPSARESTPVDGRTSPSARESTPVGGRASPSARESTPVGGRTSPSARESTPVGGRTSPSARESTPVGGRTSPSARESTPVGGRTSPSARESTPVGDRTSPSARESTPVGDRTSPWARESTPVGDRTSPSARESTPVGGRTSPSAGASNSGALRVGNLLVHQIELDRLLITERQELMSSDRDAWLDDSVIDAFLLCAANSASKRVSSFSTAALPTMSRMMKTRTLGRYLRERYNVCEAADWLVPFNLEPYTGENHWTLFIVSHCSKRIVFLDSLQRNHPPGQALTDLIALVNAGHHPGSWSEWTLVIPDNTLRQDDGRSCGLFVCLYADILCTKRSYDIGGDYQGRRTFFDSVFRREVRRRLLEVSYAPMYPLMTLRRKYLKTTCLYFLFCFFAFLLLVQKHRTNITTKWLKYVDGMYFL